MLLREITILGDVVKAKLEEKGIPPTPYILIENLLVLVAASKVSFFIPFSEIPITLQTLAVVMIGAIYGTRAGLISVLAYLLLGFAGVPVFSGEGAGLAYMAGNSGGFLAGFVLAVWIAGKMASFQWDRDFVKSLYLLVAAQLAVLASGIAWMKLFLGTGATVAGIALPLLPGLALKTLLGALILKIIWEAVIHYRDSHETAD